MIELRDVHKAFGRNKVLQGVNMTIPKGESMVIIGGSGTGKSVALKCVLGLITPDAGSPSPTLHDDATSGAVTSTFVRDLTRGEVYVLENLITTAAGRSGRKRITIRCE